MAVNSFRDLRVWQAGIDLVERVYNLTRNFPAEETYGLRIQMRRASVSIPSNIAEGHTRAHRKEFLNHLSIAQGSLAELQTQLEIAGRLNYVSRESVPEFDEITSSLAKQLNALRSALTRANRISNP